MPYIIAAAGAALLGALQGVANFDPGLFPPGSVDMIRTMSGALMLVGLPWLLLRLNKKRVAREKEALMTHSPMEADLHLPDPNQDAFDLPLDYDPLADRDVEGPEDLALPSDYDPLEEYQKRDSEPQKPSQTPPRGNVVTATSKRKS